MGFFNIFIIIYLLILLYSLARVSTILSKSFLSSPGLFIPLITKSIMVAWNSVLGDQFLLPAKNCNPLGDKQEATFWHRDFALQFDRFDESSLFTCFDNLLSNGLDCSMLVSSAKWCFWESNNTFVQVIYIEDKEEEWAKNWSLWNAC